MSGSKLSSGEMFVRTVLVGVCPPETVWQKLFGWMSGGRRSKENVREKCPIPQAGFTSLSMSISYDLRQSDRQPIFDWLAILLAQPDELKNISAVRLRRYTWKWVDVTPYHGFKLPAGHTDVVLLYVLFTHCYLSSATLRTTLFDLLHFFDAARLLASQHWQHHQLIFSGKYATALWSHSNIYLHLQLHAGICRNYKTLSLHCIMSAVAYEPMEQRSMLSLVILSHLPGS